MTNEQKPKAYIPECCDFCRYCQCRFLKKYMDNIYRCKLMRYKTITTSINERPEWCPLKPVENETVTGDDTEFKKCVKGVSF